MKVFQARSSKIYLQKSIFVFIGLGFLSAILICWLTEYLDPPFSYLQVIIESMGIILLGCFTEYLNLETYPKNYLFRGIPGNLRLL